MSLFSGTRMEMARFQSEFPPAAGAQQQEEIPAQKLTHFPAPLKGEQTRRIPALALGVSDHRSS
jgi:hypothetical protein